MPNPAPASGSGPGDGRAPGLSSDAAEQTADQVIAELHGAARTADVALDDPLGPVLGATAGMLRVLDTNIAAFGDTVESASQTMTQALGQARATAQASRDQSRVETSAVQAAVIEVTGASIAHNAEQAIARHQVVLRQNRAIAGAFGIATLALGALGAGYWQARSATLASIQATQTGLRAAFSANPADAPSWVSLMQWNQISEALRRCQEPGRSVLQQGSIACTVPLWIAPPTNPPPVDVVLPAPDMSAPDSPGTAAATPAPENDPKRPPPHTAQGDKLRLTHPLKPLRPQP